MSIVASAAQPVYSCTCAAGPSTWMTQLVPIITICAPLLAVFTFWLGYRQREKERRFSFFNDVVVTPCMAEILKFFSACSEELLECAREQQSSSIRKAQPRKVTAALTRFSQDLFALKGFLVERMEVFDHRTTAKASKAFEKIEQDITCWFGSCTTAPASLEDLDERIRSGKRAIVRVLYSGKIAFLR